MSKFKDNVPGFPGYHVTKDGEVYSMKCRSGKRPRNILTRKGGRKRAQYYKKYRTRTYCRICGKKKNENKESKSSKR